MDIVYRTIDGFRLINDKNEVYILDINKNIILQDNICEKDLEYILMTKSTPLDTYGVIATLNVVLGLWNINDAANAVKLTPNDLIREALAWRVASDGKS